MADNNGFTSVPTKGNKKKAAGEKAAAKTEALQAILAEVDKQLQKAITDSKYIETHDSHIYFKRGVYNLLETIINAAAAAKKTTVVADADAILQAIVKNNKEITNVVTIVRARVAANAETNAVEKARQETLQKSVRAQVQTQLMLREQKLVRLYNYLYDIYDIYTNPARQKTPEDNKYVSEQAIKLKLNITPLLNYTTHPDEIRQFLNSLHKDLNES